MMNNNSLFGGVAPGQGQTMTTPAQANVADLFAQQQADAAQLQKEADGAAMSAAAEQITGKDPVSQFLAGYLATKGAKQVQTAKNRKEFIDGYAKAQELAVKQKEMELKQAEAYRKAQETGLANARPIVYSNLPVLMSGGDASAESRKQAVMDTATSMFGAAMAMTGQKIADVTLDANNPDKAVLHIQNPDGSMDSRAVNSIKNELLGFYPDDAVVQQWVGAGKESKLEKVGVMGDDGKVTAQYAMRRPDGTFVGADGQSKIDAKRIVPYEANMAADPKLGSLDSQRAAFNKFIPASLQGDLRNLSDQELRDAMQAIVTNRDLSGSAQSVEWQTSLKTEMQRRDRMVNGYNTNPSTPPEVQAAPQDGFGVVRPSMNESESKNFSYALRMENSNAVIDALGETGFQPDMYNSIADSYAPSWLAPTLTFGDSEQMFQAQRDFINANLRRESGAVISDAEFANARAQYFPQPGDSPEVLAQKAANRKTAIQGISTGLGPYQRDIKVDPIYEGIAKDIRARRGGGKKPSEDKGLSDKQKKALDLLN